MRFPPGRERLFTKPLLTGSGHPRGDLLLERQQLLPRRPVTIRADRTYRLGDHPDQAVVDQPASIQCIGFDGGEIARDELVPELTSHEHQQRHRCGDQNKSPQPGLHQAQYRGNKAQPQCSLPRFSRFRFVRAVN